MLFFSEVLVVNDQTRTYMTGSVMAEWRDEESPEPIGALEVQGPEGVTCYSKEEIFAILPSEEDVKEAIHSAYQEFQDWGDEEAWMAFKVYLRMLLPEPIAR